MKCHIFCICKTTFNTKNFVQEAKQSPPRVLWSLYFNCPDTSESDLSGSVPKNVYLTSGPDLDIDFEFAVKQVSYKNLITLFD